LEANYVPKEISIWARFKEFLLEKWPAVFPREMLSSDPWESIRKLLSQNVPMKDAHAESCLRLRFCLLPFTVLELISDVDVHCFNVTTATDISHNIILINNKLGF